MGKRTETRAIFVFIGRPVLIFWDGLSYPKTVKDSSYICLRSPYDGADDPQPAMEETSFFKNLRSRKQSVPRTFQSKQKKAAPDGAAENLFQEPAAEAMQAHLIMSIFLVELTRIELVTS